jgi:hypothetical protein
MFLHPLIHCEIARQQHRDVLARSNGQRITEISGADGKVDRVELESNRFELASRRRELSRALIDRHGRRSVRDAA